MVTDGTGAVVPGAAVTAIETGTGAVYRAVSSAIGTYTVRGLPAGLYNLACEASGFKKFEMSGIRVQVNEAARVDLLLTVGPTTESITVSGQVLTVDTTEAAIKTVVDNRRIGELPLNGRNPTQLMRLVAGVVLDPRGSLQAAVYPGAAAVSVNGGRSNTTNYMLDGAQNNDHYNNVANPMPNPDALQEFSVQTNNFSAEFGRNSGGVVNAVTKNGTNELRGSAFEYVRNNALNAANFFAPIKDGAKMDDGLKRNQFGATLGGPVVFPKAYSGKGKTFFFFSYQETLVRQAPIASQVVVPTAAQRGGDFSSLSKQLRDPFRGGVYAGNRVPASDISPITKQILEHLPVPVTGNTIFTAAQTNMNDRQYLARGDHQLTQSNKISVRYWRSYADQPGFLNPKDYLELTTGRTWLNTSVAVTDTQVISPRVINQALFSFNRTFNTNVPVYPGKSVSELGIKMWDDKARPQWRFNVSGYFEINTVGTNSFPRDEYQVRDTARWSRGRHELSFGGEYSRALGDINNNYRNSGFWEFNGAAPFTGDSLADFLVGRFNTLMQGVGEYKKTRFHMLNLFVNDSAKMTRRLTLTLGLRWEPFFPYTDVDGKLAAWHPGQRSTRYTKAPLGVVYPGDAGVPGGGSPVAWRNLGPRFGFAWDVFGNGRTSVRGAYGVFFDQPNTTTTNSPANQAPFGTVVTTNGNTANSLADPYAGTVNPFPMSTTPPSDVTFPAYSSHFLYAPDARNPYVQSWNLTVEREIRGGFLFRSSYAGSKGSRLVALREINAAVYSPGATTATTNQRRPMAPALGSVTLIEPVSNSTYHAWQLTAERRFSHGFSVLANYQFAKSIDDASAYSALAQGRTNPNNQAYDKGLSDFDRRHVLNLSSIWELPVKRGNGAVRAVFGGWSVNGIVALLSGLPLTVLSGVDNARTGTASQRVDMVANPYLPDGRKRSEQIGEWLRRSAFDANALGTFGTLGRNTFTGPGMATVDLGTAKSFRLRERITTTLRFEMFNAFNRVNLQAPNTTRNNVKFMQTSAAFDPRILQLAVRLTF